MENSPSKISSFQGSIECETLTNRHKHELQLLLISLAEMLQQGTYNPLIADQLTKELDSLIVENPMLDPFIQENFYAAIEA